MLKGFFVFILLFFTSVSMADVDLVKEIAKIKKYIDEGKGTPELKALLNHYEVELKSKSVVPQKTSAKPKKHPVLKSSFVVAPPKGDREPASKPLIFPLPAEAVKPAEVTPEKSIQDLQITGFIDLYYSYNLNRPNTASPIVAGPATSFPGNNSVRYYDIYHDQMSLNLAELSVRKKVGDITGVVDLHFGQAAELNTISVSSSGTSVDETSKHIGQAYVSYAPKEVPGLTVDIGKMASHIGLEYIRAKDNWNYSRSTVFGYGGPFWHTGVHVAYEFIPSQLTGGLYLYNGWNNFYETNAAKTLGGQVKWTPNDKTSVIYNVITGPEKANNSKDLRTVHELNAAYVFTPKFTAAIDLLMGRENNNIDGVTGAPFTAEWYGGTASFKWQVAEWYYVSPRYEYYKDKQGFTLGGPEQSLQSYTLTHSFKLDSGLETRFEYRLDQSDYADRFLKSDGRTTDTQSAFIWSLLVNF